MRKHLLALMVLMPLLACSKPSDDFRNVVWTVDSSSSGAPGTLYVFLSEGTLIITRAGDKPMTGKWTQASGELTMTEEGISYRVEILKQTPGEFHIRSHNPGTPVDIYLKRANQE